MDRLSTVVGSIEGRFRRVATGSAQVDGFSNQQLVSFDGTWFRADVGVVCSGGRWPVV